MANSFFQFKKFTVQQDRCAMKVTTDACLFGAWVAEEIKSSTVTIDNCIDVGSGTGLLSLMIAQKTEQPVIAIEIDRCSFDQAKENIATSPFEEKINIFHGDIRNFEFTHTFDVIVSNPPFYENELQSDDSAKNIALHSEELSLDELFKAIVSNISTTGVFFLLLPYKRKDEISDYLKEHNMELQKIVFVKPSYNHDYSRIMLKGNIKTQKRGKTYFDEISIWTDRKEYTIEFRELLRDYYLYL